MCDVITYLIEDADPNGPFGAKEVGQAPLLPVPPAVANAVMGSVPPAQAGIASGTNSALRELGGVFGVAILASVFASHGGYGTSQAFVAGFTPAVWVAVGLSSLGVVAAVFTGARRRPQQGTVGVEQALALEPQHA